MGRATEENKALLKKAWAERTIITLTFIQTKKLKAGREVFTINKGLGYHIKPYTGDYEFYVKNGNGRIEKLSRAKFKSLARSLTT